MISFSIQKNFIYIPFFITFSIIQKSVLEEFKFENEFSKLMEFSLKITLINVYLIEKKLHSNGATFEINYGIIQEVKHLHLHIITRYKYENIADVEEIYKVLQS